MESQPFTWDDLRVLLAVHHGRSFLAAGRALGMSTSTVARRISALEAHLGRSLVRRASDGASLEPGAAPLLALAEQTERRLAVVSRDLTRGAAELAGTVRVSLGEGFVRGVAHALAELRRDHPETQIELVAAAHAADLTRREADIGVRTMRSHAAAVVTTRAGVLDYGVYASERYLARAGVPRHRADLARHDFVGLVGALERQPEIQWLRARGAVSFPFRANTSDGVLAGVLADQGVAALPAVLAGSHPQLRRLDLGEDPPAKPVYVAMHRDLRAVPRVRAVADVLRTALLRGLRRPADSRGW